MQNYESLRAATLALFPRLIAAARAGESTETLRRLREARERLVDGRLTVVVCGEFKRGKSSLLNALLEQPGLLPVDDYIATSAVTTLSYGETEEIEVVIAGKGTRTISRDELPGYVTEGGNRDNRKGVELVAITTPAPRLAGGLTLVDTPGVGGYHTGHTAATMAALPSANVLLFVADATQPLTQSELRFLRRAADAARLTKEPDSLLFVLTKIDLVADTEVILANTRAKLAEVTGRPAADLTIVPVSSQAKLDHLESGDPEDLEISNFGELEELLWTTLTRRRARVLLGQALTDLELSARALAEPIEAEHQALRAVGQARAAELREAMDARQRTLNELAASTAAWRGELTKAMTRLARGSETAAEAELARVWDTLRTDYLYDDELLYDPGRLVGRLADDVALVVGAVNRRLAADAARLQREFARRNGLALQHTELARLPAPPVSDIVPTGRLGEKERPNTALRRWRETSTGSSGGAAIGGALGFLLGGPVGASVGAFLGSLAGGVFGARTAIQAVQQQDREARRRSLLLELEPFRRQQRLHLSQSIERVCDDFAQAILAELDSRIAQERRGAEEAVRRAKATEIRDVRSAERRAAELAAERSPLEAVSERVDELARLVRMMADDIGEDYAQQEMYDAVESWTDEDWAEE